MTTEVAEEDQMPRDEKPADSAVPERRLDTDSPSNLKEHLDRVRVQMASRPPVFSSYEEYRNARLARIRST
jgi:hypothetical protein